jgi:nitroreductase
MSDHPKLASADHDIHELILQRWSPRAFDASRAISHAELLRLFEAARWSPSSGNEQPWRFIVIVRDESSEIWRSLIAALAKSNQTWAPAASVLVVTAVRLTLERNEAVYKMAWYDAGQAVAVLTMQATAQGISVRQMEGFDAERVRDACAIPAGFDPAVVMAIGYAGDPDVLPLDRHRDAERQPRQRKPIADFVFGGRWGNPL